MFLLSALAPQFRAANGNSQMFDSLHPNALMQVPRGDALAQFIAAM
jgi:hypothetical protein